MEKGEKCKTCVKILRLTPPMTISALKPGPVVPPGTQKTPDQAARNSQSAVFGHLSDILAFFRGVDFCHFFCHIFMILILSLFSLFAFSDFDDFCVFAFSRFYHFFTFLMILMISCFLIIFHCFSIS